MEKMIIKINEFSYNHHPSGVNLLAKIIKRGFSIRVTIPRREYAE
jgi:hypothetical protein